MTEVRAISRPFWVRAGAGLLVAPANWQRTRYLSLLLDPGALLLIATPYWQRRRWWLLGPGALLLVAPPYWQRRRWGRASRGARVHVPVAAA